MVHERIATPESRTAHEAGWGGCLDGLLAYLERGTERTVSPAAGT